MIYYENENYLVKWDEAIQAAIMERKSTPYVAGELVRTTGLNLLALIESKQAKKFIHNAKESKVASLADQEWLIEVFYRRIRELNVWYVAIILPKSTLTQLSTNPVRAVVDALDFQELKYFTEFDEAYSWISTL